MKSHASLLRIGALSSLLLIASTATWATAARIIKDEQGRILGDHSAALAVLRERIATHGHVALWLRLNVEYDPDVAPESRQGIEQEKRVTTLRQALSRKLASNDSFEPSSISFPVRGPFVAVHVGLTELDMLISDPRVRMITEIPAM